VNGESGNGEKKKFSEGMLRNPCDLWKLPEWINGRKDRLGSTYANEKDFAAIYRTYL
jgi:hypothetical protein